MAESRGTPREKGREKTNVKCEVLCLGGGGGGTAQLLTKKLRLEKPEASHSKPA